ncbi:alpha/beta hydrolase [Euhalothece natronophila Z-M001]|uniref:Palmitoyl-protein thioesterase ABHD10, mitochondrial n=1 Tax=Euhalothece natronophila Z-M001 TaxID=522448 RepID=A0A5B8NQM1_9CHRO|nr:alpha/beta hydrolase [Euhalothece natronophila]QDZ41288.1 alpha/beta hydrolase [Euhalothece natronophila Z-M001]
MEIKYCQHPDGTQIAYRHHPASSEQNHQPGLLFLPGYGSDMEGTKATTIFSWAKQQGVQATLMDYGGHGNSSGEFREGTLGQWTNHARYILETITSGPQILIGSSMGGWIMMLLALQYPQRISGLMGIATAIDFISELVLPNLSEQQKEALKVKGETILDYSGLPLTQRYVEEAVSHNLLKNKHLHDLTCPVTLIHGLQDSVIPWRWSCQLQQELGSDEVTLVVIKQGNHRLSDPQSLDLLVDNLARLWKRASTPFPDSL